MIIKEYLKDSDKKKADWLENDRIPRLKEMRVPEKIIKNEIDNVERYRNGSMVSIIKNIEKFEKLEILKKEVCTGRGGKTYVVFDTPEGWVGFFPNAQYGRFLNYFKKGIK